MKGSCQEATVKVVDRGFTKKPLPRPSPFCEQSTLFLGQREAPPFGEMRARGQLQPLKERLSLRRPCGPAASHTSMQRCRQLRGGVFDGCIPLCAFALKKRILMRLAAELCTAVAGEHLSSGVLQDAVCANA